MSSVSNPFPNFSKQVIDLHREPAPQVKEAPDFKNKVVRKESTTTVFVTNFDDTTDEQSLRAEMAKAYGPVDSVRL